ncbi:MAG TPA: glycine zipper 2TM domain-containing protein [Ferruginibacter sp.]|nr:glycine zipper 2TM domain-containing protein [Ferruginibacter sp.]
MKNDDEIVQDLIAGGLIGATLGTLLSKNKEEGALLGTLAGAVILATYKASEKARETNVPVYVEDKGSLYLIQQDGSKKFIRKIDKPSVKLQPHFKLK